MDLNHILNWRLLSGSHDFPGSDGGTCINEAAIVAAGFEYRAISSVSDCPPCFSRPIAAYAIGLNDGMPDDTRQRLLPFVMRLSGSADTTEVERERAEFIAMRTIRQLLPVMFRALNAARYAVHIQACENATDLNTAAAAARAASTYAYASAAYAAAAADAAAADATYAARAAARAAAYAADAAYAARDASTAAAAIWDIATDILDGALKIGKQAESIEPMVVAVRMEKAKSKAIELA